MGFDIQRIRPKGAWGEPKTSFQNEENIIKNLIDTTPIHHRFCIDIGAGDGATMSNSYPLFKHGWSGLAVEVGAKDFSKMAYKYIPFDNVGIVKMCITPDNVLDLFSTFNVPIDFGFLSLDIDGYDYYILEKILSKYKPSIICTEVNLSLQGKYATPYSPDYKWDGRNEFGYSLDSLNELIKDTDYKINTIEKNLSGGLGSNVFLTC